jgi:undecaprenyl-diphosphatase
MGIVQCLALIPGVSRSGATISAGLFRGLDRVASTRVAFLLGIPALVGAAVFELPDAMGGDVGVVALVVGTLVSFVVAYGSVAWLIRFVAKHTTEIFAFYRILIGIVILILLATGTVTAT